MLFTLSRSLDQATGLDASTVLVDSANFDSSTRLLKFNLFELSNEKKRLERIQRNCQNVLSKMEYSCEYSAVIEPSASSELISSLGKLGFSVSIDNNLRPKVTTKDLKSFNWPVKDEFDLKEDVHEIEPLFHWIGVALKPDSYDQTSFDNDEDFFKVDDTLKYFSIEAPLIPFSLISPIINNLSVASTRLILSLNCCKLIPPNFLLNSQRSKHFNERKFDPSACTADQRALALFKTPLQTLSFRLNSTA